MMAAQLPAVGLDDFIIARGRRRPEHLVRQGEFGAAGGNALGARPAGAEAAALDAQHGLDLRQLKRRHP